MTVNREHRTLVLTAFPAEADAVIARVTFDDHPVRVVDGRHFYLGTLGGRRVVVAMTGIGMRNAAHAAETALRRLCSEAEIAIDAALFAGVAGGSGRTSIGDVAVPRRWTSDRGATWYDVDADMLHAATALEVRLESASTLHGVLSRVLARRRSIDLRREPTLHVGGEGSSGDFNDGTAFPAVPFGGAVFGPQPRSAPDFSAMFTGNFFTAVGAFVRRGVIGNIRGFLADKPAASDAVDQETAAAHRVADEYGVPFLGIRGMSDGPGDPLDLPGYPLTFCVYRHIAATNAAIVTEAFLTAWNGAKGQVTERL